MGIFTRITNFLKEVKIELKKVTWPTRQETMRYTWAVVGISLGVALFLGVADLIFQWIINRFVI